MSNNQGIDWPSWITAIGAIASAVVGGVIMLLKNIFVTHRQLRETVQQLAEVNNQRHKENIDRFGKQDTTLGEIRESVARIEGQITGRYPRIDR